MKPVFKALVCGSAFVGAMMLGGQVADGDPPIRNRIPKMADPVIYDSAFCTYVDQPPFVTDVNWDHPLIKAARASIEGVSRSTMSYGDHVRIYELDGDNSWSGQKGLHSHWWEKPDSDPEKATKLAEIDARVAQANYENFIKTLLGECRDYPYMIQKKLEVLAYHTPVNQSGAQGAIDPEHPFDSLSGDGYSRMRTIMKKVYTDRQNRLNPNPTRFNYNWNEVGHSRANRVDNSVKPWTHAEMRYLFEEWLAGPEKPYSIDVYEAGLQQYIADKCDSDPEGPDLGYMYDFRGHKNFKANWFECNSFIWNSRDAARMAQTQIRKSNLTFDPTYYQHPFASRYKKSKELMAAYLFYPNEHHEHMRKASEPGGGPHLYVHNTDVNDDGVAEYSLFENKMGQGDIGLGSQALKGTEVAAGGVTNTAVHGLRPYRLVGRRNSDGKIVRGPWRDWGFNTVFTVRNSNRSAFEVDQLFDDSDSNADATFKLRMARLCTALDRHTNWGPTHFFSPQAQQIAKRYSVRGAYSPIVAMSYEISKSHSFAVGNYPQTHPKDKNVVKFMFIVKFPTKNYYDERDVKAGKRIKWDDFYLNESSLSNDYYTERALDKFGWIPADDISSAAYLAEADGEDSYFPPSAPFNPTTTSGGSGSASSGSTPGTGTGALLNAFDD